MISFDAQNGFDFIVTNALKNALNAGDDHIEVQVITDSTLIKEERMVLLTVSSYLFRAMTAICFTLDAKTKAHLATIRRSEPALMSEEDFLDVVGEIGNIFCGGLNRDLSQHFPYLGMSTPNVLKRECLDHFEDLDANHIRHFEVTINGSLVLHASLCVCDFADIHFKVDTTVVEESHGELEMF